MIRVWGGGVFEPDIFYEICDELGILVWQDCELLPFKTPFQWGAKQLINVVMFACGVYPAHPEFLKSVEAEARDNVTRIRHHPSLVLFCGNNEDCKPSSPQFQLLSIDKLYTRLTVCRSANPTMGYVARRRSITSSSHLREAFA